MVILHGTWLSYMARGYPTNDCHAVTPIQGFSKCLKYFVGYEKNNQLLLFSADRDIPTTGLTIPVGNWASFPIGMLNPYDAEQTARMRRLVCTFDVRMYKIRVTVLELMFNYTYGKLLGNTSCITRLNFGLTFFYIFKVY